MPLNSDNFLRSFPLQNLRKCSFFRCPCQICHNSALWALLEQQFAANFSYVCTLSACKLGDDVICAEVFSKPLNSASFFEKFQILSCD